MIMIQLEMQPPVLDVTVYCEELGRLGWNQSWMKNEPSHDFRGLAPDHNTGCEALLYDEARILSILLSLSLPTVYKTIALSRTS